VASLPADVRRRDPEAAHRRHEVQPLAMALGRDAREDRRKRHYLWRAVDHEGEVLESFVTKTRDKKAALEFPKKAMRRHAPCDSYVTDKLRSYGAA
jgi:transposase-like protein